MAKQSRYYCEIHFNNRAHIWEDNYITTKPMIIESNNKRQLISDLEVLIDDSVRKIYILDRSNNNGTNFNSFDERLKKGGF